MDRQRYQIQPLHTPRWPLACSRINRLFSLAFLIAMPVLAVSGHPADDPTADPPPERPRTILVLSGGGARGAAHVGVLKVLEELNIPVDAIVGTSMGSIVGGLYASGLSPDLMDNNLRRVDWEDAFDDNLARKRTNFHRKEDDLLPLFPFELGFGPEGFKSSKGFISGQKVGFLLGRLTLHTLLVDHFDHLRLPFRAIAADLEDGSMVVLEDGNLAKAMRASMAIPGVFTPVEWNERTLVDGGITRNLPVEVAQGMSAARIIAIDIGTPRRTLQDDESVLGIFSQTISVLNSRNVAESKARLGEQDLLIVPDLGDIRSDHFDRVGEAIDLGETSARTFTKSLQRFSVSPEQYQDFLRRQRLPKDEPLAIPIHQMEVTGSKHVHINQITQRIRTQPGTILNLSTLRDDLDRLYQIGEFERVEFSMKRYKDVNQLVIDTHDKSWGPGYLRAGLTFFSDLEGESDFQALINFRRTQLNRLGAEWKTLITIGDQNLFRTEFFQPLDYKGFWFVMPRFEALRDEFNNPVSATGIIEVDSFNGGIDLGVQIKNYAQISLGIETGNFEVDSQFSGGFKGDRGGIRLDILFDQIDYTDFPRRGSFGSLEYFRSSERFNSDQDFDKLAIEFIQAWSHGPNTWLTEINFGTEFDTEIPTFDEFSLGGFSNLSGLQPQQLRGDELVYAGLTYYRQFGKLQIGASFEAGNIWQDRDDVSLDDLVTSGLIFIGRSTFIGPLYLGYGRAEAGEDSFYLFLGQLF